MALAGGALRAGCGLPDVRTAGDAATADAAAADAAVCLDGGDTEVPDGGDCLLSPDGMTCPACCAPVIGQRVDRTARCRQPATIVACRAALEAGPAVMGCWVNADGSEEIYLSSDVPSLAQRGWVACTLARLNEICAYPNCP